MDAGFVRFLISAVGVVLLLAVVLDGKAISWEVLVLYLLVQLPWLGNLFDTLKLGPQGLEAKFRSVEAKVDALSETLAEPDDEGSIKTGATLPAGTAAPPRDAKDRRILEALVADPKYRLRSLSAVAKSADLGETETKERLDKAVSDGHASVIRGKTRTLWGITSAGRLLLANEEPSR